MICNKVVCYRNICEFAEEEDESADGSKGEGRSMGEDQTGETGVSS